MALVGVLGGMIGLGGAEFRLPLLIGLFGFVALQAVVLNEAMSLLVVLTALPARLFSVPWSSLSPHWFVAVNLLAGSLVGAWVGATWATRMRSATLYRVLAVLLVLVAAALAWSHSGHVGALDLPPAVRLVAGAAIGIVAALMGVAGGAAYPNDRAAVRGGYQDRGQPVPGRVATDDAGRLRPLQPRRQFRRAPPATRLRARHGRRLNRRHGIGGLLLGVVPNVILIRLLVVLLILSAIKVWRHP